MAEEAYPMTVESRNKTDLERERRMRFLERLEPWVVERLLPCMRLPADDPEISLPAHGERTMVFFVAAGGREMVLRCFDRRSDRAKTQRAVGHSLRRGVPVPRVLFVDCSRRARARLGVSVLVEERIPGVHSEEYGDRPQMLSITARAVSRMHNVYRSRWGNLRVGRRRGYYERMSATLEKHLAAAGKLGSDLPEREGDRIRSWLDARRGTIRRIRRFSYSHKSLASDNVVISPDGKLTFIDVQRLSYEHYAANLIKALWVFPRDREEAARFLDEYFAVAEGRTLEDFGEWRDLFDIFHYVRVLVHALIGRRDGTDTGERLETITRRLTAILDGAT